jgi:phosphomethylpyrimidine synthase
MKTQLEQARAGVITPQMVRASEQEGISSETIRERIADRSVVIPYNPIHSGANPRAIGFGTRVKVNVNMGTSADQVDLHQELLKVQMAHDCGADAVMDLSTGGDLSTTRRKVIERSGLPVGTVPVYEAFEISKRRHGDLHSLKASDLFEVILQHAKDGVDFITVHAGLTQASLERVAQHKRIMGITSRGGALLAQWMRRTGQENPLYERYDELLAIAAEYDVTLSLGDALRPGCLADATDRGQVQELIYLGELAQRAYEKGVQVIIEGPGHVPLNEVASNMQLQKKLCQGAPFYVLGPVVCDVAPGYDHISSAIGASIAALNGADFLCYVTPAEHLRLPTKTDVREGIMAFRIAAMSADLARGLPYAVKQNTEMAWARRQLDWGRMYELAIDPDKAKEFRAGHRVETGETCTMCGDLCAVKVFGESTTH